ncbi:MAG: DDE-type integrase/transposase/recombinase [Bacteroidota bacterium]|nr:DDE-type integrase/transposase/recombinase [Bacteroidota bacterium]
MKKKNTYPALYRWAYATGRERELIPMNQQNLIPKQTKSNWRCTTQSDLHLLEEELGIKEQLDVLLEKEDLNWHRKKKLLLGVVKLHFKVIDFIGRERYLQLLGSKKEEFIILIEQFSAYFSKSDLLKWFRISPSLYQIWYSKVHYECDSSKMKLCAKRHPFQITNREFRIIETNLKDPDYLNWPKSAIHSELLKKGRLHISRSTFYKHASFILPDNIRGKGKKPSYSPLRASYVNEYWHMDLSYFTTKNGNRSYIYAIIDNFSRKIIAWDCKTYISKKVVGEVICKALQTVSIHKLNLVSDGGSENINHYINHLLTQFLDQQQIHVDHLVALKTIKQSNSMIERFFRIMKSNYLYFNTPFAHEELVLALEKIIYEYNYLRPHYALNHLTPAEVFSGIKMPDLSKDFKAAKAIRFKKNKNCDCTICICDEGARI